MTGWRGLPCIESRLRRNSLIRKKFTGLCALRCGAFAFCCALLALWVADAVRFADERKLGGGAAAGSRSTEFDLRAASTR